MNWRLMAWRDWAAIAVAVAIVGTVLVALVAFPNGFRHSNWGFGPGWECSHPGDGDPVCVKKPAPKTDRPG